MADAVGTSVGAVLGTSTTTTFVESSAGVSVGGRTGLTSLVTALLFLVSLFLSPIFLAIPSFATAPALVIVGFMMLTSIVKIDFSDYTEAIPCFIAIIAMPFMYSISEGIAMGVISYVAINLIARKENQCADVHSGNSVCTEVCADLMSESAYRRIISVHGFEKRLCFTAEMRWSRGFLLII